MRIECIDDLMVSQFERVCHASESAFPSGKWNLTSKPIKPFKRKLERGLVSIEAAKSPEDRNNRFCSVFINPPSGAIGHSIAISSEHLDDLGLRIVELATMIDEPTLRSGRLNDSQWITLTQSIQQLRDSEAHLVSGEGFTFSKLHEISGDIADKHGPIAKVFIDATCLSIDLQAILPGSSVDKGLLEPFTKLALKLGCGVVFFH